MRDNLVLLKPPKSPNSGGLVLMQSLMGETPKTALHRLRVFPPKRAIPRLGG
ncbi:hypothetical protein LYNGBM3L_68270 [Moorena producens 3L]|uniref:Uncharacterized protein n=1 Tax=Moorena producens 3L TaxID=489825 RepID=F4Y2R5_9CYAN|nr:hypothetical protein LYNGBM3L_68270 [Moorena producens 3L]